MNNSSVSLALIECQKVLVREYRDLSKCWDKHPDIKRWLKTMNPEDIYEYSKWKKVIILIKIIETSNLLRREKRITKR